MSIRSWFSKRRQAAKAKAEENALKAQLEIYEKESMLDEKHKKLCDSFVEAGLIRIKWANSPQHGDPYAEGYLISGRGDILRYKIHYNGGLIITKI